MIHWTSWDELSLSLQYFFCWVHCDLWLYGLLCEEEEVGDLTKIFLWLIFLGFRFCSIDQYHDEGHCMCKEHSMQKRSHRQEIKICM